MKTIELVKIGKNWNISTIVNNMFDEFISCTSKKKAEEIIKKYVELGYIYK